MDDSSSQGILSEVFQERPSIFSSDLGKSGWSNLDTAREFASLGLLGIDWAQTRTARKNPSHYQESNKLLGPNPSIGTVNNYFGASMLGHALLMQALPPEWRSILQYGTIGLEGMVTSKNKMLGLGMTF